MWIEVEELITLVTDEVVASAWPTTCYTDGLRHLEESLQSGVIDWCDSVDSDSNAENNQGRLKLVVGVLLRGDGEE